MRERDEETKKSFGIWVRVRIGKGYTTNEPEEREGGKEVWMVTVFGVDGLTVGRGVPCTVYSVPPAAVPNNNDERSRASQVGCCELGGVYRNAEGNEIK